MGEKRIALIHDELVRRGGAEVVFEELAAMFPQADLFTLYAGRPVLRTGEWLRPVKTSYLQRWPVWLRRQPGRMLPFLAHAAEQFDFSGYDIVVSSASAFAKAIVTRSNVPHLSYCHTPTRYLWDAALEVAAVRPWLLRLGTKWLQHYLRLVDFTAAQRVDLFIANSQYTQARIAKFYRRASEVIYPPINLEFFCPPPKPKKGLFFLLVGRLTPSKRFDCAIRVCEKLALPLVIVGTGLDLYRLKKFAGRYTRFAGAVSPEALRDYYRSAQALLQPGIEDFGMAMAEALACGTPFIAYGHGGAREISNSGQTGALYDQPQDEVLAEAIRQFTERRQLFDPQILAASVANYGRARFRKAIYKLVEETIHSRQTRYGTHTTGEGAYPDRSRSGAYRKETGAAGEARTAAF